MRFHRLLHFAFLIPALAGLGRADFVSAVVATNPEAYWRLDTANANSVVNGYTTTYMNGASSTAPGGGAPLAGYPNNAAVQLNGANNSTSQYVSTNLSGGIPGTGTIMAWVNLSELPSTAGAYFYVAGESQVGNDFDLQFQNDNKLYLYTGGGENTSYTPDPTTLVGDWHMIVATYDSSSGFRDLYWDGTEVASYSGGVNSAAKNSTFDIGYSTVFGGRDFDGSIDEVGVWNYALTSSQVASLYASADTGPNTNPAPEPASLALMGCGLGGFVMSRRLRWRRG